MMLPSPVPLRVEVSFRQIRQTWARREKKLHMHPYQDQIDKMWDLIKHLGAAQRNGFWLEVINLRHVLLEIELRLLLSSKAGESRKPIPPK